MDGEGWMFPAASDILVEILTRLPPSTRRLLRLVCRLWRDVVDERTQEMRSRAVLLVQNGSSSYVVDDLSSGRRRELWTGCAGERYERMCVVGTCNGLLCLCDTKEPGGGITMANPATGETPLLPLLPCSAQYFEPFRWRDGGIATSRHEAYCFAYLPTKGQYRIVHVPCYPDRAGKFEAVQVFTLGEKSWRNVPTPGTSCRLDAGVLSIDGAMHWLTVDTEKVMSLDLEKERVTPVKSLPAPAGPDCHLTVVRGRLGIAISDGSSPLEKIEVWVLEGSRREGQCWSRRYSIQVHISRDEYEWRRHQLTQPQFAHGEYVLTKLCPDQSCLLYRNRVSDAGRLQCGVVRLSEKKKGTEIGTVGAYGRTFAYVMTAEPLDVYRVSDCSD
uniref:Uncharacterized protein n=1 Tax=Avena sativa TaxID=4498 RepID=A0ACD5Y1G1_AVESA